MGQSLAAPIGNATWTGGGGSGIWSTASNWSDIPTTSGTWNLTFGGTTYTTSTNNIGTITLGTMSFTNDGTSGKTGTFALSGSILALQNSTITTTSTASGSVRTDTVGNALSLIGQTTIAAGSGHNLTFSGAIDGAGSLSVIGPGNVNLTGSSSYSGGTAITGGIVQNGVTASEYFDNAFGVGDITVSGSGAARIRNNSTIVNNFTISGSGGGLGALRGSFGAANQTARIQGSVTLTGDATVQTAATVSGTGGKLVLEGAVNLGSNMLRLIPTMAASTSSPLGIDVTGVVSGSGSVVVTGTGATVVYMNNANTYSGGTTLESGVLRVGNGSALGTGDVTVNGGTLDLNGKALSVASIQSSDPATVLMSISGTGSGDFAHVISSGLVDFGGALSLDFTQNGFANGDYWQLFSSGSSSFSGGFSSIVATGSYGNLTFTEVSNGEWRADIGTPGSQWFMFYENDAHEFQGRFAAGQLVLVPEPSTLVFAGIGIALAAWSRGRKCHRYRQPSKRTA